MIGFVVVENVEVVEEEKRTACKLGGWKMEMGRPKWGRQAIDN